ncbi:MAG: hypothetical protein AAFV93_21585 [Chloroflexota bacterium]
MRRLWAIIGFVLFGISFFIHFIAYFGINLHEEYPAISLMPLLIFIYILPTLGKKNIWKAALETLSPRKQFIVNALTAYIFIHFMIVFFLGAGQPWAQRNSGDYYLYRIEDERRVFVSAKDDDFTATNYEIVELNEQAVLRDYEAGFTIYTELTEEEYYHQTLSHPRIAGGHMMLFFMLPAIYLWNAGQSNRKKKKG